MKASSEWPIFAAGLLAVATLTTSALGLIALQFGGEARVGPVPLLKIAAGYDRRAEPLLAAPKIPSPRERRSAVALSRGAIAQFPYDISAWLRLAYVDYLDHGGLTSSGLYDLKRSYDLVAVDSELGFWRVRFALENSPALTADVRASVRQEVSAMWTNPNHRRQLEKMGPAIHNPAGRLSLALWLNRLDAAVAK
jgi:hypothetical protein